MVSIDYKYTIVAATNVLQFTLNTINLDRQSSVQASPLALIFVFEFDF